MGEDDGLEIVPEEERGHPARFIDVGTPDAQGLVNDGRRVEDEELLAARGAVIVDEGHRGLDHLRGHVDGIGDGCRAQNELRVGAVEIRDPFEPPQDVGQVAAEDAAVVVEFVDDDVLQVLEELDPLRVVGEDAAVEHVGVGQDDVPLGPDGPPCVLRSVAVVGEDPDLRRDELRDIVELRPLVLGEGLGREKVDGPARRIAHDGIQDRQVVAEGLSGGRGCHDDHVLALLEGLPGAALVGIKA